MYEPPPPPGFRLTRKATTGQAPPTSGYPEVFPGAWDQWLNRWTSPMTAKEIDTRLQEALNLYNNTLDKLCHGSACPPPDYLAPTLYRRAQEVKEARSQLDRDTSPTDKFTLGSAVYDHCFQAGKGVFWEANATYARHLQSSITLPSFGNGIPWSKIALGAAVIAGIYGVAKIAGAAADTSRETRRLFRGGT